MYRFVVCQQLEMPEEIESSRKVALGTKAKSPTNQTIRNNAFAMVVVDGKVNSVDKNALRILSRSRHTAVRSPRHAASEIAIFIKKAFIIGKWHERLSDHELSVACKLAVQLGEDENGCNMRPIQLNNLYNFDDTGRFHFKGATLSKHSTTKLKLSKANFNLIHYQSLIESNYKDDL